MTTVRLAFGLTGAVLLVLLGACGGATATGAGAGGRPASTVRVLAAASLTAAFTGMAEAFEARHPGVDVEVSFAASSALARQIEAGAPADVVATADEATLQPLIDDGDVVEVTVLARNRLTILVEEGNPANIAGLADLGRDDLVVVMCAAEVPCGRLARAAVRMAEVDVRPASLEENVTAVTARVVLGEADAGIVYVTDARAESARADSVGIDVAADPRLEAVYPIGVVRGTGNPEGGRAWVDFTRSPEGRTILARQGFLPP